MADGHPEKPSWQHHTHHPVHHQLSPPSESQHHHCTNYIIFLPMRALGPQECCSKSLSPNSTAQSPERAQRQISQSLPSIRGMGLPPQPRGLHKSRKPRRSQPVSFQGKEITPESSGKLG